MIQRSGESRSLNFTHFSGAFRVKINQKKILAPIGFYCYSFPAMITEALTRKFEPTESNFPYIIPALRNGMTVKVTKKIAKEFALADPGIQVKGSIRYIEFAAAELGLVAMTLKNEH